MAWERDNVVLRCNDCREVRTIAEVTADGCCSECAGIRWKIAYKLTDKEEAALAARGFVFTDEQWSSDPQYKFAAKDQTGE